MDVSRSVKSIKQAVTADILEVVQDFHTVTNLPGNIIPHEFHDLIIQIMETKYSELSMGILLDFYRMLTRYTNMSTPALTKIITNGYSEKLQSCMSLHNGMLERFYRDVNLTTKLVIPIDNNRSVLYALKSVENNIKDIRHDYRKPEGVVPVHISRTHDYIVSLIEEDHIAGIYHFEDRNGNEFYRVVIKEHSSIENREIYGFAMSDITAALYADLAFN